MQDARANTIFDKKHAKTCIKQGKTAYFTGKSCSLESHKKAIIHKEEREWAR